MMACCFVHPAELEANIEAMGFESHLSLNFKKRLLFYQLFKLISELQIKQEILMIPSQFKIST